MNDLERRLQQTLREHLDGLEMPDRISVVQKRARRARLMLIATVVGVVVAGTVAGAAVLNARSTPEVADQVPDPRPTRSPLTPVVIDEVSFRGSGAFDLAAGSGALWVAVHEGPEGYRSRLVTVDPRRNKVKETGVVFGELATPAEVEVSGDTVWVRSDELVSIDALTNDVLTQTRVPAPGLAVGHDSVWTTGARIDLATGRVVEEIPDIGGGQVVTDDRWVWITTTGGRARVSKLDPETDSVASSTSRDDMFIDDVATDGDDAWAAWSDADDEEPAEITEISGTTNEIVGDAIEIPKAPIIADMAFAADRLWVIAQNRVGRESLYQIDPEQHKLVGEALPLDGTLLRLTSFGNSLWVSDFERNVLTRIDLRSCDEDDCDQGRPGNAEADNCPIGIEGDGLVPLGESMPPRPYFEPFNTWRTRVGERCVVLFAGWKREWDTATASEGGFERRGAVMMFDFSQSFTTRERILLFSPIPTPVRVVDSTGTAMEPSVIVQSLRDCSLASFRLLTQEFEPVDGDYHCPRAQHQALMRKRAADDHDTRVVADCFEPSRQPVEMTFTCADADYRARQLEWRWSSAKAVGRGIFECYGSACQWQRRGTITLTGGRYCENHYVFVFSSARIVYDRAVEGRRSNRILLDCGFER